MLYGVGINDLGISSHKYLYSDEEVKLYNSWVNIITASYSKAFINSHPTRKRTTVCKEWQTLSNYIKDIKSKEHYKEWLNKEYVLDLSGCEYNNQAYNFIPKEELGARARKAIVPSELELGIGINDLHWGSTINKYGKEKVKLFRTWRNLLTKNVDKKWHKLSAFVNDIQVMQNYDLWVSGDDFRLVSKSNNYSSTDCCILHKEEAVRQNSFKTKRNSKLVKKYGIGINDTAWTWVANEDTNYRNRVYALWDKMLKRSYSEKYHEKMTTYKDCNVCERWHTFSNFYQDVPKIEGYELWLNSPNKRISLDKDIKGNGGKLYSLETCCFVTMAENVRERNQRLGMPKGHRFVRKPIVANFPNGEKVRYNSIVEAARQHNMNSTMLCRLLKSKKKDKNNILWEYA